MKFEELKDPKREKEGVVCVGDRCVLENADDYFKVLGEACSECQLGVPKEELTEEIANSLRVENKLSPLE